MAWLPISQTVPQYHAAGEPASGYVLKFYRVGTSTNISLATDDTGGTTATSVALNAEGFPEISGSVIIPHLEEEYKIVLYPTQAAADADTGAIWSVDGITPAIIAGTNTDINVKVSSNDTTAGYLNGKLVAGTNISFVEGSDGGNETLTISSLSVKGADAASATSLVVGAGNYFDITGTTAITSIATIGVGTIIKLHFDGVLTLTHHATDLVLPGSVDITTVAGDEAEFVEYAAGDWRCLNYQRSNDGTGTTEGAVTATTSGTEHGYTGIPAWVTKIYGVVDSVSTNGTADVMIQIGDSGGYETATYKGYVVRTTDSNTTVGSPTGGFNMDTATTNGQEITGTFTLVLMDSTTNMWAVQGQFGKDATQTSTITGTKALSATLDRIRIIADGVDTFDNGSFNIRYE